MTQEPGLCWTCVACTSCSWCIWAMVIAMRFQTVGRNDNGHVELVWILIRLLIKPTIHCINPMIASPVPVDLMYDYNTNGYSKSSWSIHSLATYLRNSKLYNSMMKFTLLVGGSGEMITILIILELTKSLQTANIVAVQRWKESILGLE